MKLALLFHQIQNVSHMLKKKLFVQNVLGRGITSHVIKYNRLVDMMRSGF
jgi:hypothetical protein